MLPENEKFIQDNLHHFTVLERAFYLRGLSANVREEMQRVIGVEFQPGYHADLWCPSCVTEMVTTLYRHYYAYLKNTYNNGVEVSKKDLSEGIEKLLHLKEGFIIHSTFPAHK